MHVPRYALTIMLIFILLSIGNSPAALSSEPGSSLYAAVVKKEVYTGRIQRKKITKRADQTWRILVVHSYLNDYVWIREIDSGIKGRLNGEDFNGKKNPAKTVSYKLKVFYMDTKNHTALSWKKRKGAEAEALVKNWKPDVIIACDDNAQEYFAKKYKDASIPVVFCGVNKSPMYYGYVDSLEKPGHNVTGYIENVNFYKTLRLARTILPGIKTVYILGDNSPTNQGLIDFLVPLFPKAPLQVKGYRLTDDWDEWKNKVRSLQGKVDIIIYPHYHTLKDSKNRNISHEKVLAWTLRNSKIPDFTFWSFGVIDGVLGSISIWGKAHGYEASETAIRILQDGINPGDIPIKSPEAGAIVLNKKRADMLGIKLHSTLLTYSDLVNKIGVFGK